MGKHWYKLKHNDCFIALYLSWNDALSSEFLSSFTCILPLSSSCSNVGWKGSWLCTGDSTLERVLSYDLFNGVDVWGSKSRKYEIVYNTNTCCQCYKYKPILFIIFDTIFLYVYGEYDACDVTLSVYPHQARLENIPDQGENQTYDLSPSSVGRALG